MQLSSTFKFAEGKVHIFVLLYFPKYFCRWRTLMVLSFYEHSKNEGHVQQNFY